MTPRRSVIRDLGEDTVARSRATLGDRHLITMGSAALLALGLVWRGEVDPADQLDRDLLSVADNGMAPDSIIALTIAAARASIRAAAPTAPDPADVPELEIAERRPEQVVLTLTLAAAAARLAERAGAAGAAVRAADVGRAGQPAKGSARPIRSPAARSPPNGRSGTGETHALSAMDHALSR